MGKDGRVERITSEVKKHDPKLYAVRASNGMVQIHRIGDRLEASDFNQSAPDLARLNPQFILALTHNWNLDGQPVEWGVEPIMEQLRSMDSWVSGFSYDSFCKAREKKKAEKVRTDSNNQRALAMDVRRDFARSCNDINTSNMDVKEKMKNGYYK